MAGGFAVVANQEVAHVVTRGAGQLLLPFEPTPSAMILPGFSRRPRAFEALRVLGQEEREAIDDAHPFRVQAVAYGLAVLGSVPSVENTLQ